MKDLSTKFMGLSLENPIIIGSSELSSTIEGVKTLAKHHPGAIVLKSLFEEQILIDTNKDLNSFDNSHTEALDYISEYVKNNTIDKYLTLIEESKKATNVPIIASINCISDLNWTSFTSKIEKAGADALELNITLLPSDFDLTNIEYEDKIFSIIENVKKEISIPISLKISNYSSSLANFILRLSYTKHIDSFVLFNRLYQPDIDINEEKITHSNVFSNDSEYTNTLRWIGILSDRVESDLVASTGIHNGESAIKLLLSGATTIQVVSTIYKHGPRQIGKILEDIEKWMEKKEYKTINDFRGKLCIENAENPEIYERIQFMKYIDKVK